jgi:hypothetical protein
LAEGPAGTTLTRRRDTPNMPAMSGLPRSVALLLGGGAALLLGACRADLGECDPIAAQEVVFLDTGNKASASNGVPMYAGQALVHTTCGNGQFCHSEAAAQGERYGVPIGLDFDLGYACDEGPCEASDEGVAALIRHQRKVLDNARSILTTIENGRMPPGRIGDDIAAQAGQFRYVHVGQASSYTLYEELVDCESPLASCGQGETTQLIPTPVVPAIGTREGDEIVRNWLACGAPVIESTTASTSTVPGKTCDGSNVVDHAGFCVYRIVQPPEPPEQRWAAIYDEVIYPFCGEACHGDGTPNFIEESQLDLSTAQVAYDALVGREAKGDECAGQGQLIVPGDGANSLLLQKMRPEPPCGDPMPSMGALLPSEVLDVIQAWIDAGAPND